MWFFFGWIIFFFVASSLVGVIQAVPFYGFAHSCNESESVVSCVCLCVNLLLFWCVSVCDKCNDFVFHYLLDYSCRVFVSFLVFSRFCTILFAHSQKNRWFPSQCGCCGCRKFVRTCSLFSARRFQHTLQSSRFEFTSSKLFGVVSFCLCSFLPHFCFGFRTTAKCFFSSLLRGDSLLFPASICCNFCVSLSAKKEIARA